MLLRNLQVWLSFRANETRRRRILIDEADTARDAKKWRAAAKAYGRALAIDAHEAAIWVQYGHALKESGDLDGAGDAYDQALQREANNADTFLSIGHLRKLRGQPSEAAAAYKRVMALEPTNPDAGRELEVLQARGISADAANNLVDAGDAARGQREWAVAATAYRGALRIDPGLTHIWVQYGHALKESGDPAAAVAAYRRAIDQQHNDPDIWMNLGHALRLTGALTEAANAYLSALELSPDSPETLEVLLDLAHRGTSLDIARIRRVLRVGAPPARPAKQRARSARALAFDATDLLHHLRSSRFPTGIQRVQLEAISSLLREPLPDLQVDIYGYSASAGWWALVDDGAFLELCGLVADGAGTQDKDWLRTVRLLLLEMDSSPAADFPHGAVLINLGTAWAQGRYFDNIREAKAKFAVRYLPFVHDLIPLVAPGNHLASLQADFEEWIDGVLVAADGYLVNSAATRSDLLRVAAERACPIDPSTITVVTLDADFRTPGRASDRTALGRHGLIEGEFVLFVSTIEPRKNHLAAFDAWRTLLDRHPARVIPKLVCVGGKGWLNDAVYERLATDDLLRPHVTILSGVTDGDLACLYESCAFTLYPSRYEGWGLPVTEALCFGKATLAANVSSLPEAGGPFADYFTLNDPKDLVEKLSRLIFDTDYRRLREHAIQTGFKPRSWRDIAVQIAQAAHRVAEEGQRATSAAAT